MIDDIGTHSSHPSGTAETQSDEATGTPCIGPEDDPTAAHSLGCVLDRAMERLRAANPVPEDR